MSKFYMIIAGKIMFHIFDGGGGTRAPPAPASYAYVTPPTA